MKAAELAGRTILGILLDSNGYPLNMLSGLSGYDEKQAYRGILWLRQNVAGAVVVYERELNAYRLTSRSSDVSLYAQQRMKTARTQTKNGIEYLHEVACDLGTPAEAAAFRLISSMLDSAFSALQLGLHATQTPDETRQASRERRTQSVSVG